MTWLGTTNRAYIQTPSSNLLALGGGSFTESGQSVSLSQGGGGVTGWQTLKVGAGGFVRGMNIASDGTMVARTDSNGAYLYNVNLWQQLFNANSLPSSLINNTDIAGIGGGSFEIQIAPTNTQIFYGVYLGYVWVSANRGTSWTQTAFTQNTAGMNPNDNYAQYGQRLAVDPNNSSIVFVGTENNGLYFTINGGTSFTQVSTSSVPIGTEQVPGTIGPGITGISFYGNGVVTGGATQTIYAASWGNGVYVTTNGGSTWTQTSGGPTNVQYAAIDSSGNYYAAQANGLFKYSGGAWTLTSAPTSGSTIQAVAINPFNQNEVVIVCDGGQIALSYNAGSTWTAFNTAATLSSPDIPWIAQGNTSSGGGSIFLDAGGLAFSPTTNGELILSAGTGTWNTTLPSSGWTGTTPYTWTDFSVGIEQLVPNDIVIAPVTGSAPILASWDRPFFNIASLSAYPSTYGPINSDTIQMGWSIDYASSNPSYVFGLSTYNSNLSGYTTDNGVSWTTFATPYQPGGTYGGTIAASTPSNIVLAPSGSVQPGYTTNGGSTWTGITLPGVSSWSNFQFSYALKQRAVTADRVSANTFYLYFPGNGVYTTSNGGVTWTAAYTGNSGYIESNQSWAGFNSQLISVPGNAGHLFYTSGNVSGTTPSSSSTVPFYRSTNGGVTWTTVANVTGVTCFKFGAVAPTKTYPSIYIVGWVNNIYGVWYSIDNTSTWISIGNPNSTLQSLELVCCIAADPNNFGYVYVGFSGGGFAYCH